MDLIEKNDRYCLHADCPGVPKDDISIHMEGNVVHVCAKRYLIVKNLHYS